MQNKEIRRVEKRQGQHAVLVTVVIRWIIEVSSLAENKVLSIYKSYILVYEITLIIINTNKYERITLKM